jgi:putative transposase
MVIRRLEHDEQTVHLGRDHPQSVRSRCASCQGRRIAEACKQIGVIEQTDYRWRKVYGGLKVAQAERLKAENARLTKAVAELTVDKITLKEIAEGTTEPGAPAGSRSTGAQTAPVLKTPYLPGTGHPAFSRSLRPATTAACGTSC